MSHITVPVRRYLKNSRGRKPGVAALAAFALALALPGAATAHNAGHIFRPDGSCLEIGSFQDAPLVGKDRTQLDLVPQTPNPPFDEFGVSFVGFNGNTPIHPGPCRVTVHVASAPEGTVSNNEDNLWASQGFNGV